jgi:hypothetical protein
MMACAMCSDIGVIPENHDSRCKHWPRVQQIGIDCGARASSIKLLKNSAFVVK